MIKLLLVLLIIATFVAVSLRFSEQHGPMAEKGCISAISLSILAAAVGILPFLASKKKNASKLFTSIIYGAIIRVIITAIGIIVITVISPKEQRFWFLAFTAVFYLLFLGIETTEAVICIRKLEFENDNESSDNEPDDSCKYESS